jgi:3',5'-cyclic-AMP phosphodiesterase
LRAPARCGSGDLIFDGFSRTKQRTQEQWDLFLQSVRVHNRLPVTHCLGNHDIWGWNKKDSGASGHEREYGKQWALDVLGMSSAFYATTCKGVRVIVLDSVQPRGEDGYEGGLGDAQFEWLRGELESQPGTPTVVVTHIPAVHASMQLVDSRLGDDGQWRFGAGALMMDRVRLVNLIARHSQVRCVLSGHIHMQERVEYAGTNWINSGAVCGSWWQPQQSSREFLANRRNDTSMLARPDRAVPGYGLLDVYEDGEIDWQYVEYGWTMQA